MIAVLTSLAAARNSGCAKGPPYPNCTVHPPRQRDFTVRVVDRNPLPSGGALISHVNGSSEFHYAFTTAWFPPPKGSPHLDGLIVRVVECNDDHHACPNMTHPEWTNAGALTVLGASLSGTPTVEHKVGEENVFWAGVDAPPPASVAEWGAADPRLAYRASDGTYFLAWDNCTRNCYPHRMTMLSTSKDPFNRSGWTWHGPLIPGLYTAGASLLFRDAVGGVVDNAAQGAVEGAVAGPEANAPLAFVGNSDTAAAILLASTTDPSGTTGWAVQNASWMTGRVGCWDECGVAPGGQPEKLSTGDFLFIYNIDTGFPYVPNPLGRCAIGWAILDRDDPTRIIARAELPLITASQPWETCDATGKGYACQEPHVAFSTGMKPLGGDEFLVIYGAADTDVGVARIKVDVGSADVDRIGSAVRPGP
jgi:predicted GH43/DUF377 family glycosyl hydrolase